MITIDLNCDLGEIPESVRDGTDDAIMACISSVNVACGGHAGDADTMERTVRSAIRRGVAVGAHPGYPDREHFGRREPPAPPEAIEAFVAGQIRALAAVAEPLGVRLVHVKPHGALYHAAHRDSAIAAAIARAAGRVDPGLVLVGLAGSPMLGTWRGLGFRVAAEGFADRRYEPGGGLRPRAQRGSVLADPAVAAAQAVAIATQGGVSAGDEALAPFRADTICIHGDTPGSVVIARAVRAALDAAGVRVGGLRRVDDSGGRHARGAPGRGV